MDSVLVGCIIAGNLFFILRISYHLKDEAKRVFMYLVTLSSKICITMLLVVPALFIINQYNDVGTVLHNELEELRNEQDELLAYGDGSELKVTVDGGEIQYNVDTEYNYAEASKKLSTVSERIVAIDDELNNHNSKYRNPLLNLLFKYVVISYLIDLVFFVVIGKPDNFNMFRKYKFKVTGLDKELDKSKKLDGIRGT